MAIMLIDKYTSQVTILLTRRCDTKNINQEHAQEHITLWVRHRSQGCYRNGRRAPGRSSEGSPTHTGSSDLRLSVKIGERITPR